MIDFEYIHIYFTKKIKKIFDKLFFKVKEKNLSKIIYPVLPNIELRNLHPKDWLRAEKVINEIKNGEWVADMTASERLNIFHCVTISNSNGEKLWCQLGKINSYDYDRPYEIMDIDVFGIFKSYVLRSGASKLIEDGTKIVKNKEKDFKLKEKEKKDAKVKYENTPEYKEKSERKDRQEKEKIAKIASNFNL
jgi:hypothetical protein